MVSTAIAVLPVYLSPIISSLCPVPIGVSASIAVRPVCKGWCTDFLVIIPGATRSIGRVLLLSMSPLPSMGLTVGSLILQMRLSTTGLEANLPVDLHCIPYLLFV